jgi:hypothetical protein
VCVCGTAWSPFSSNSRTFAIRRSWETPKCVCCYTIVTLL